MTQDPSQSSVRDNPARGRFELHEDGHMAFASYRRHGALVLIPHVEAPPAHRGHGMAGRLMEGIVALARAQGFKLQPICSYAASWFRRHPQMCDVLR